MKAAVLVLTVMLAFAGLYALLLVAAPGFAVEGTLQGRAGMGLAEISNGGVASTILGQTRHLGVAAFCAALASIFVVQTGYKRKERSAWFCILAVGAIVWGYGLAMQIAEGDVFNIVMHLVGIALLAIGLLLPIKEFFGGKAK